MVDWWIADCGLRILHWRSGLKIWEACAGHSPPDRADVSEAVICKQPSTIVNEQSIIDNRQSTISNRNRQSAMPYNLD
jgi:hypothetical protein